MSVNIFGDRGDYSPWLKNGSVIKQIKYKKGKLGDYINEISNSISIGLIPYQKIKDGFLQLNVVANKVISDDDVSQYPVTPVSYLVIWKAIRNINEPFSWIATSGPVGPCGKDATDFSFWFPKLTAYWWRKEETCSFYFDDADKDGIIIDKKKGKATYLRNRSGDCFNAKALRPVRKREKPEKGSGYSLLFDKSLYFIDQVTMAHFTSSFACLFISFKVSEFPKNRQYLVTSSNLEHALSIEGNKIRCRFGLMQMPLSNWSTFRMNGLLYLCNGLWDITTTLVTFQ